MHAAVAIGQHARRRVRQEHRHAPGRRRSAQQQGRQIGEDLLVPAAIDRVEQPDRRSSSATRLATALRFSCQIRMSACRLCAHFVQEHRLPGIVAIPGNADHRKRIGLAEQARQHGAAPHGRRRIAVLHIAHRRQSLAVEQPRRAAARTAS